jgi:O-acetyl-ADP-ribose deacetylase (regulator of RNase III)
VTDSASELYLGGTRIDLIVGDPLDHLYEGLYTGTNARGVMGAGLSADIRRKAGAEVERELRTNPQLLTGQAYLTGPGMLAEQGLKAIAHGVVVAEPGESPKLPVSIDALLDGLRLLEEAGCRTVTIPEVGWRVFNLDHTGVAAELGKTIATHLRRRSRLQAVCIVSRHPEYLRALRPVLERE